jgi:hypothetical protein
MQERWMVKLATEEFQKFGYRVNGESPEVLNFVYRKLFDQLSGKLDQRRTILDE